MRDDVNALLDELVAALEKKRLVLQRIASSYTGKHYALETGVIALLMALIEEDQDRFEQIDAIDQAFASIRDRFIRASGIEHNELDDFFARHQSEGAAAYRRVLYAIRTLVEEINDAHEALLAAMEKDRIALKNQINSLDKTGNLIDRIGYPSPLAIL